MIGAVAGDWQAWDGISRVGGDMVLPYSSTLDHSPPCNEKS